MAGLCHVCSKPAMVSCRLCGRLVCTAHMDDESGICISCSMRDRRPGGAMR